MTKTVILNPNSQKTNKRQTIVFFSSKILKFCLRIKTFLQMLEKEVFFVKFRTIILIIAEIHEILVKKLTSDVLIFKIVLKDWKIITVSNIEQKYEPCREINKMRCFLQQGKLVNNITLNSIKSMKIFRVTILSLKYVGKSRRTSNKLKIIVFITNCGFCRQTFTGLMGLLWQSLLGQTSLLGKKMTWKDRIYLGNVNWVNRFTWKNSSCTNGFT